MVDIHSHILPGVDDGAQTLEESLAMLDVAARAGTTDIVATPHANSEFRYDREQIAQKFSGLTAAAGSRIRLHLGCDFHLSYENVQDALRNPTRYTINNLSYLMVELPETFVIDSIRNVLIQLRSAGMIPVITHPERNSAVQMRLETLRQWVENGCLLQVTGQSLLGRFGPIAERSANDLLRRSLVHFIASDAHDCEDRPPRLDVAHAHIANRYNVNLADRLCRVNPAAVLDGSPIGPAEPLPRRKWYQFWSK